MASTKVLFHYFLFLNLYISAIQLSIPFVYEIYQAASEDVLDIPKVRQICKEWVENCSSLDLAVFLKLDEGIVSSSEFVRSQIGFRRRSLRRWDPQEKKN